MGTLYDEIDNYIGDDLISAYPCYLVTDKLATALMRSGWGASKFATSK